MSAIAIPRDRTRAGVTSPRGRIRAADLVRIGVRGLRARRLRTALTALGISVGIAAMLAVIGISESSRAALLATLDRLGSNLLTVTAGQTFLGAESALPEGADAMVERVAPVEGSSGVTATQATARRTDRIPAAETGGITVQGADLDLLATLRGSVAEGRWLDAATAHVPVVVLGSVAAERLGIDSLDAPVTIWIGGQWWVVIGILEPNPLAPEIDRSALVGQPVARSQLDADAAPTTLYVRAADEHLDDVRGVLPATANPMNPESINVSRPSDAIEAEAAAATAFTALLVGLGAVALLVGALGIANVMLMAVVERRSEIGLRRALGATRGQIAAQFVAEATLLSVLGGAAGSAVGEGVAAAYAASQGWPVALPALALGAGVGAALVVGALAGVYPALRAAATPPTEALRA